MHVGETDGQHRKQKPGVKANDDSRPAGPDMAVVELAQNHYR
jgi:hypothetical protein